MTSSERKRGGDRLSRAQAQAIHGRILMHYLQVLLLALIQGLAELLPVSSSAHVIVAEKLMGLNPSAPEMTFLLVMLHTGTMFAVILYFWPRWRSRFVVPDVGGTVLRPLILATGATGFA